MVLGGDLIAEEAQHGAVVLGGYGVAEEGDLWGGHQVEEVQFGEVGEDVLFLLAGCAVELDGLGQGF